jgi:hypothetical protein
MLPKYKVEYGVPFRNRTQELHYETDDPVACEAFLSDILERDFKLFEIKHEGESLPKHDFDRFVKSAANLLAAKHICAALGIKAEEERFRFGFAA